MPTMSQKSPIADRLERELGSEFELHKNDETTYGGGSDLPAGINGGIAQLTEMKIDEYKEGDNKGKLYLQIAGVVKSPEEHAGVKIAGLHTRKMLKLFANNRDSKEQAVSKALNEVRKMGGITSEIKARDLPKLMEALKNEAPHFRFRTYSFTPPGAADDAEPMIIHEHKGKMDNYESNGSSGVVDNTGTPSDAGASQVSDEDWDAVLAAANSDDGEAQTKLQDTCKAMGMTAEEVDAIGSWEECVEIIRKGGAGGGSSEQSGGTEGTWKPEVNDEITVKLKGMKSAQKLKVKQVFKTTLHLYNETTKKDYKGIDWTSNPPTVGGVEL
jgi:hypothetical protein